MFESVITMLVYLTQACVSASLLLYQSLLHNSLPSQLSVYMYYMSSAPDPEHLFQKNNPKESVCVQIITDWHASCLCCLKAADLKSNLSFNNKNDPWKLPRRGRPLVTENSLVQPRQTQNNTCNCTHEQFIQYNCGYLWIPEGSSKLQQLSPKLVLCLLLLLLSWTAPSQELSKGAFHIASPSGSLHSSN